MTSLRSLLSAILTATALLSAPALAQQANRTPPAIIAVIDNQRVSRDAAAYKAARQQADQYRAAMQQEFSREEERLRQENQELERQRTLLAPEAFEARNREFQTKVVAFQRRLQERNRSLDVFIRNTQTEVQKVLTVIVQEMANERGFNLLLDKNLTFYSTDPLDITNEVLSRLDRRLPVARVPAPGATQ